MTIRTQLKAGGLLRNHNEALKVRTALKAGGENLNHNEALQVRSTLRAGALGFNHNEALRRETERPAISMRKQIRWTGSKQDRLALLVVRAGLRAGRRAVRAFKSDKSPG
jgi:hypothetical protein